MSSDNREMHNLISMSSEPTQRGNPLGLTIKQHVLPAASISRFSNQNGRVSVHVIRNNKTIELSPKDKNFCADRLWHDGAEHGYMKRIEDAFQRLANRILQGTTDLNQEDYNTVSEFYSLCELRAGVKLSPPDNTKSNVTLPDNNLTKAQEESLERNGYMYARGSVLPSRFLAGLAIQVGISRICPPKITWAITHSNVIEFIVPDSFGGIGIVPLSPNYCLVANAKSGDISPNNAVAINQIAINKASDYYFARDFSKCMQ